MGCPPSITPCIPVDEATVPTGEWTAYYGWQWPFSGQSRDQPNPGGTTDANEPTSTERLLQGFDGHCRAPRHTAELFPWHEPCRTFPWQDWNPHRGAFRQWNPGNESRVALREHDFERSPKPKQHDWTGAPLSAAVQPVPFIDLSREAARRARVIGTASLP